MNTDNTPPPTDDLEASKDAGAGYISRLVRLSSDWRYLADLCDSEIQRAKTTPLTIIMSDDEKVRYEQAARTYRFCADALTSETDAGSPSPWHLETAPQQIQKIVKKAGQVFFHARWPSVR